MAMNVFRLSGDLVHVLSILCLLWKLARSRSCVGISCRMQEMYAIVFCCRYIDLLYQVVDAYNSIMKVVFIISTFYLIYLMQYQAPISQTYDPKADNFPYHIYLLPPAALLTLLTTESFTFQEVMWTFSIWVESVAIIPQLVLLQHLREVENLTSHYVATMGLYRSFYILNWFYRYVIEKPPYVNWISWIGGVIQTALYLDFFYYYALSKWYGQKLVLPFTGDV